MYKKQNKAVDVALTQLFKMKPLKKYRVIHDSNIYCPDCHYTQKWYDRGEYFECVTCRKRLYKRKDETILPLDDEWKALLD